MGRFGPDFPKRLGDLLRIFNKNENMENTTITKEVNISRVQLENEEFYKISNSDAMRPFFMSIVSDSNHWMFISSNGGLTAGRKDAEYALFPYYTDDKITESADITGSKTIFQVQRAEGEPQIWEPFSERFEGRYAITRNLYKNLYGNKIIFEEINEDLKLTFRYQWNSSNRFGFVKTSQLINRGGASVELNLLDGIQNIVPASVESALQARASNLIDAYKRSELEKESGLGIYALSAIIVDRAEPSEALKAQVAWSLGIENPSYLLSSLQLKNFRKGLPIEEESDVKAEKGAYFVHTPLTLDAGSQKEWMILADVNKNHAAVAQLSQTIQEESNLAEQIREDVALGTQRLIGLNAASDGLQISKDPFRDARHFSNTLFNIMRGGIFDMNYQIEKWDFSQYLQKANKEVFQAEQAVLSTLPEEFTLADLQAACEQSANMHFKRLCYEYMPLKFSRRHGDPSRPWNRFSINTRSEVDGSKILDYEGNWRDIFQNWEALAHSYPAFAESMIHKFLNATTFDGYNPYRVTKGGFDWETIEADDPWSYIGYWGDHQIIYLLKLLELLEKYYPGQLAICFDKDLFVYANVPYRIKSYEDIVKDPKDTIEFDHDSDHTIREDRQRLGADGALLKNQSGAIHRVNLIEKTLATVLAKLSNFIPEGGIWMNTQRPEWNDANNALVGNGVSMVTLYYLRRFLNFFNQILADTSVDEVPISEELATFYERLVKAFEQNRELLSGNIGGKAAKEMMDRLGHAASEYRLHIYDNPFTGAKKSVNLNDLSTFVQLCNAFLEHAIRANKREDNLYHAYNLLTFTENNEAQISYLDEMLEGQVAVLSSGYLSGPQTLELLDSMKGSALFRPDQYSYILYPNKNIAGFKQRNNIPETSVNKSKLLTQLIDEGHTQIIEKDVKGQFHFNGNFRNAYDLKAGLDALAGGHYDHLLAAEQKLVLQIFEEVFNHKAFTGRSGTFFGYEGLGSIYWHMVSKLLLAVQESSLKAIADQESAEVVGRLLEHYYEIQAGIGVHKPPTLYGAFPTDPYSHTPGGKGAQQPGMTGQVKEDIISRFGEVGVCVKNGHLSFDPCLLRKEEEFLTEAKSFTYVDINQNPHELHLDVGTLAFTYCQVPVVYRLAEQEGIDVLHQDGSQSRMDSLALDAALSAEIFARTGAIRQLTVHINPSRLR